MLIVRHESPSVALVCCWIMDMAFGVNLCERIGGVGRAVFSWGREMEIGKLLCFHLGPVMLDDGGVYAVDEAASQMVGQVELWIGRGGGIEAANVVILGDFSLAVIRAKS